MDEQTPKQRLRQFLAEASRLTLCGTITEEGGRELRKEILRAHTDEEFAAVRATIEVLQ